MKIVTKEFLNENAYSSYPIDSRATFEPYSKEDASAINSLLLDLKLTVPESVATTAFIANIKVTPALVSLVIMGSKETPYYEVVPPLPNYSSDEYTAFNAVVLATVAVSRNIALNQIPVRLEGQLDGVGGWVVFGPGVQNTCNWSFSSPASSAISSSAITRYKYGGVRNVAKKSFAETLDGAISLTGQNGIEIVQKADNVLAIQFSGTTGDISNGLSEYMGLCGIRPETETCAFTPIRTVNNVKPELGSDKKEIVLILDAPLYAERTGTAAGRSTLLVSSDQSLESLCQPRLQIPEYECRAAPLSAQEESFTAITPGRKILLEAASAGISENAVFEMVQQHPNRVSVSVFKPVGTIPTILGEQAVELHIDQKTMQWQVYGASGPSLRLYGPLEIGLSGHRMITVNDIPRRIAIGNLNILDNLNLNSLSVKVDSTEVPNWAGTYTRQYIGTYIRTDSSEHVLKLSPINSSWSVYYNNTLVAAGSLDSTGFGMQTQSYKDASGTSKTRTVTAVGVNV